VHFILGNRDVNKLRMPVELHDYFLAKDPIAYWDKDDPSNNKVNKTGPDSAVDRLKWMLLKTMGSPGAFEYRKTELREMSRPHDDQHVVESYLESLRVNGNLTKFIAFGEIGHIVGDVLFLHGGITKQNRGYVPAFSRSPDPSVVPSVHEWIQKLNDFASTEIGEYKGHIEKYLRDLTEAQADEGDDSMKHWGMVGGYNFGQPGSGLIMYGMGAFAGGEQNPSVIYSNFLKDGKPFGVDAEVAEWLRSNGINRVISGHQPHGDAPLIIDQHGIQIITGDTSYAVNTKYRNAASPSAPSEAIDSSNVKVSEIRPPSRQH